MHRNAITPVRIVWLMALSLSWGCASDCISADVYVSPLGNDTWTGNYSVPNADGSDGPVATIERAQSIVRQLRAEQSERQLPVVVSIRGGFYELSKPLEFTAADGGTLDSPTRYEAFEGEVPVFSGGRRISNWIVGSDNRWTASLPRVAQGKWEFSQLFVNDQRRFRPSLPAKGYFHVAESLPPSRAANDKGFDQFKFSGSDLNSSWTNLRDVEVLVFHHWCASRMRIASIDPVERTVQFTGTTAGTAPWAEFTTGHRYRVDNVKEALTEAGQWYLAAR